MIFSERIRNRANSESLQSKRIVNNAGWHYLWADLFADQTL
jgi:hypothetical protein